MNLIQKYCGGVVPDTVHDEGFELPFDLKVGVFVGAFAQLQLFYKDKRRHVCV